MLPWSGVNVVYLKGVVNGPDEGEGWYVLKLKRKERHLLFHQSTS